MEKGTTRDGFGIGLKEVGALNSKVVALSADLTESMRVHWFKEAFPDRFIEMGVAEENMAGLAAGLALGGHIPFAASYAVFSPGNSWGVIRSSICYSNLNVKLVGGHTGVTTGQDGATHQALEDIALTQVLPNMTVVSPADQEEARLATHALAKHSGPAYLRVGKFDVPSLESLAKIDHKISVDRSFVLGKADTLREGKDIYLIATGTMVTQALLAAIELAKTSVECSVINIHTIKPLDTAAILKASALFKHIVTLEEHQTIGGLGSAVAQVLAQSPTSAQLHMMGIHDRFGQSGKPEELLEEYGLSVEQIVRTITKILK